MHRISPAHDGYRYAPGCVLRLDAATGCDFVSPSLCVLCQQRRCLGEISTNLRLRTLAQTLRAVIVAPDGSNSNCSH